MNKLLPLKMIIIGYIHFIFILLENHKFYKIQPKKLDETS